MIITQEVGSLKRPLWNQMLAGPLPNPKIADPLKFEKQETADAMRWGRRLEVDTDRLIALIRKGAHQPLSEEEKKVIIGKSVEMAVRLEESTGLDRVYNGEQTRTEMYDFLVRQTQGMYSVGMVNSFDSNYFKRAGIRSDVVVEPKGIDTFVDELEAVQRLTKRTPKPCLTGPYTMMDWSFRGHYEDLAEAEGLRGASAMRKSRELATLAFADNVLNPIVRALARAGARVIQVDEPAATTDERESELFVEALNRSFRRVPVGVERAVHLCYSNYPSLFPALKKSVADTYLIEFTNHASPARFRPEDVDPIAYRILELFKEHEMKASVAVGVIDNHSDLIETKEVVRDRLLYAHKVLGGHTRVQATPDCGLRTRSWDVSHAKLSNMVEGAAMASAEI